MKSALKRMGHVIKNNEFFPVDITAGITLLTGIIILLGLTIFSWNLTNILKIEETLPGINGIGFIEQILRSQESQYLKDASARGVHDFVVHPRTQWSEVLPILVSNRDQGSGAGGSSNRLRAWHSCHLRTGQ